MCCFRKKIEWGKILMNKLNDSFNRLTLLVNERTNEWVCWALPTTVVALQQVIRDTLAALFFHLIASNTCRHLLMFDASARTRHGTSWNCLFVPGILLWQLQVPTLTIPSGLTSSLLIPQLSFTPTSMPHHLCMVHTVTDVTIFFLLFGLWDYWHCGHSWPIVPSLGW
jgi:hypothetical protein